MRDGPLESATMATFEESQKRKKRSRSKSPAVRDISDKPIRKNRKQTQPAKTKKETKKKTNSSKAADKTVKRKKKSS